MHFGRKQRLPKQNEGKNIYPLRLTLTLTQVEKKKLNIEFYFMTLWQARALKQQVFTSFIFHSFGY